MVWMARVPVRGSKKTRAPSSTCLKLDDKNVVIACPISASYGSIETSDPTCEVFEGKFTAILGRDV